MVKGGQAGNKNGGGQGKQALEIALRNNGENKPVASGIKCLVDIWNEAIRQAKEGNAQYSNMIIDRLDGKPAQSIDLSGEVITQERVLTPKEVTAINDVLDDDC